MDSILVYGSQYGFTRRYADALSARTGIPAVDYRSAPVLASYQTIVYLGGLYAGRVTGLSRTMRKVALRDGQRLIVCAVGLGDPAKAENRSRVVRAIVRQLPPALAGRATCFVLRGGIDYSRLSAVHRAGMAMLCRVLRSRPAEAQSEDDRMLLRTYGTQVDFTDLQALDAVVRAIQRA